MYSINVQKFQNTPRNDKGIAATGEKRIRLPQEAFEAERGRGHIGVLHPTKGWRLRNLRIMAKNGEIVQTLERLREQAFHRMLIEREERKKQRANRSP